MAKPKTNKLSIYLIKEEYKTYADILKEYSKLTKKKDAVSGIEYFYPDSIVHAPKWIENFFLEDPKNFTLKQSSAQLIALVTIDTSDSKKRIFAIPFGNGIHLLNVGVCEERFGLKVVLNTVDEKLLKSIDKKNMANVPKHAKEQISVNSEVDSFGVDIEQDLILGVTGKSKVDTFGKVITGKDVLYLAVKNNIQQIADLLKKCYSAYINDSYKKNFGWIDYIQECRDQKTISELNDIILNKLQKKEIESLWMAVPEIITWEDIDGFKFPKNSEYLYEDISIHNFYDVIEDGELAKIDLLFLKKQSIKSISSTGGFPLKQWKIYDCIYAEIEHNKILYMLTNGKFYAVETSFKAQIDKYYNDLLGKTFSVLLPVSNTDIEDTYNKSVIANDSNYCLMDKKMIYYGGGYSSIEFCDLYHNSKTMFHVKVYGGSAVLSHLFNQALVSSELFCSEKVFRNDVNNLLAVTHKIADPTKVNTKDYTVVLGILSTSKKALNLPFFSKVSLKNVARQIESLGYSIYIQKIQINNLPPKKKATKKPRKKKTPSSSVAQVP